MGKINNKILINSNEYRGYYEDPKSKLIKLAKEYKFKSAVEIGCGSGANLIEVKKINPDCFTLGIDLRLDLIEKLQANESVDQFFLGNAFEVIPKLEKKFELIILSHVLEHFSNPEILIKECLSLATKDTIFLIALPNIRHLSVLMPLIFLDEFEYKTSGILDNTHLRFFTKKSAIAFIEESGLEIIQYVPEINNGKSGFLNLITFRLISGFCAHAYNFICKVKV
jgi:2-polyprenyl-3-methyl-5-hydroxy-6-metoxy-1,4-benzoquinol methylase